MKMYFLDPHSWGQHWTVCAESPEEALELIKQHMLEDMEEERREHYLSPMYEGEEYDEDYHIYPQFKNATPDKLPQSYKLHEYELGHVMSGEWS